MASYWTSLCLFPHLWNGENNTDLHRAAVEITWANTCNVFNKVPVNSTLRVRQRKQFNPGAAIRGSLVAENLWIRIKFTQNWSAYYHCAILNRTKDTIHSVPPGGLLLPPPPLASSGASYIVCSEQIIIYKQKMKKKKKHRICNKCNDMYMKIFFCKCSPGF